MKSGIGSKPIVDVCILKTNGRVLRRDSRRGHTNYTELRVEI
jgi:hypothetical protein